VTALLEVQDLHKHFGGVQAVEACSFTVAEGQITGLIGPNGAGKSTAIDLISGFKIPDTGTVLFEGKQVQGKAPHKISRMGLIRTFQSPREWPALSVLENLILARYEPRRERFWRSLWGPSRAEKVRASEQLIRARAILDEFGLLQLRERACGQPQRRPEAPPGVRADPHGRAAAGHPRRADGRCEPGAR